MRQKYTTGIYKITNPLGQVYIGQSKRIERRICDHKTNKRWDARKLKDSFIKYGVDNHIFEIELECSVDELNDKERYYQILYESTVKGLNLSLNRSTTEKGSHHLETKIKMSILNKGRKHTKETRLKMSNAVKKNLIKDPNMYSHQIGKIPPCSRMCLNVENGVFYDSIKDASRGLNIKYTTFRAMLFGVNKNKTYFILC